MPDAALLIDRNARIRWANEAWYRKRNGRADGGAGRLDGADLSAAMNGEDAAAWEARLASMVAANDVGPIAGPARLPEDGEDEPWIACAAPVRAADGSTVAVLLVGARRAPEASDSDVEIARRIANALSHEINNPLFVISATLEDLVSEISDPGVRARLQIALDSVWKVSDVVRQAAEVSNIADLLRIGRRQEQR